MQNAIIKRETHVQGKMLKLGKVRRKTHGKDIQYEGAVRGAKLADETGTELQ